jgi:hypothetical protein
MRTHRAMSTMKNLWRACWMVRRSCRRSKCLIWRSYELSWWSAFLEPVEICCIATETFSYFHYNYNYYYFHNLLELNAHHSGTSFLRNLTTSVLIRYSCCYGGKYFVSILNRRPSIFICNVFVSLLEIIIIILIIGFVCY